MFGPNDTKPSSGKLIVDVVREKIPGYPSGANNFVDVRDVVRGMILVSERGKRGERYILGGENLPYREVFERIARVAGVRAPSRRLPRPAASVVGFLGDMQELLLDRDPLLNTVAMRFGFCTTFQFSSEKAEREIGYTHGPLEPAIADAIAFFRKNGMLR
jgi:dihydroflavonol-4-reductase